MSYDGWSRHLRNKPRCERLLAHLRVYCKGEYFNTPAVFRAATEMECMLALWDISYAQLHDPTASWDDRLWSAIVLLSQEYVFFFELIRREEAEAVIAAAEAAEAGDVAPNLIARARFLLSRKPADWKEFAARITESDTAHEIASVAPSTIQSPSAEGFE